MTVTFELETKPVLDESTGLGTGRYRTIVFEIKDGCKTVYDIYEFDGAQRREVNYVKRQVLKRTGLKLEV
jgi:hypothetical protein